MTTINIQDDTVYGYRQEMERRGRDKKEVPGVINAVLKEHLSDMQSEKLAAPTIKKAKAVKNKTGGVSPPSAQSAFVIPARGAL